MATSTGAPWNLPSPTAPEQPDGPSNFSDLADAVHVALGRAYPCVSTARPSPTEGMLIFETDTDRLLVSHDGTNWRVLFSAGTVSGSGGTVEQNDVLTASTGFAVSTQRFYKTGGLVFANAMVQRTGTTITAGSSGNITNISMATIAAGWRPPLGNWPVLVSGGASGNFMTGYVSEGGQFAVGALCPNNDWTSTLSCSWAGCWPCGDG